MRYRHHLDDGMDDAQVQVLGIGCVNSTYDESSRSER